MDDGDDNIPLVVAPPEETLLVVLTMRLMEVSKKQGRDGQRQRRAPRVGSLGSANDRTHDDDCRARISHEVEIREQNTAETRVSQSQLELLSPTFPKRDSHRVEPRFGSDGTECVCGKDLVDLRLF